MRTVVAAGVRGAVVLVLAVLSLRAAVWLIDGNDPSSDADIGIGLVPIAVVVLVSGGWAFADARRHEPSVVRGWWTVATLFCGIVAAVRGMDSVTDAVLFGVFSLVLVGAPAYVGSVMGRPPQAPRAARRTAV